MSCNSIYYLRGEKEINVNNKGLGRKNHLLGINSTGDVFLKVRLLIDGKWYQTFYINKKNLDKYQEKHGNRLEVLE